MSFDFDLPHAQGPLANGAGVQPWSSPEQYVIFSIDYPGTIDWSKLSDNWSTEKQFNAWLADKSGGFKRLVGHYTYADTAKGSIDEPAWCINARDWRKLAASGWIDGQESVLHLSPWANGGRPATLWFANTPTLGGPPVRHKPIGTFQLTTEKRAKASDAWTFDPSTGDYYICQ